MDHHELCRVMLGPGAGLVRETYSLDDLEKDNAQEAVDLGSFLVCASHLGLHSLSESARSLERAGNYEDARKE